jgi:antitoxin component HigA of HigAB toxin-antitoxin module
MSSTTINETSEIGALGNFTDNYRRVLTEIKNLQHSEPEQGSSEAQRLQRLMDIRQRYLDVQASVTQAQAAQQTRSTAGV